MQRNGALQSDDLFVLAIASRIFVYAPAMMLEGHELRSFVAFEDVYPRLSKAERHNSFQTP